MDHKKTQAKNMKMSCRDHTDQELAYFCDECQALICPECVVHGIHKSHQVHTFNKALHFVVDTMEEGTKDLASKIQHLDAANETLEKEKRSVVERWKTLKGRISNEFEQLVKIIGQKRDVIEKNLEEVMRDDVRKLEEIQEKNISANLSLRSIHENVRAKMAVMQKVELLDFYVSGYKSCMKAVENEKMVDEHIVVQKGIDKTVPKVKQLTDQIKQVADQIVDMTSISGAETRPPLEKTAIYSPAKEPLERSMQQPTFYETLDLHEFRTSIRSPTPSTAKATVRHKLATITSPQAKPPLTALEARRVRKIATSPSYQKYLQHKRSLL